MQCRLQLRQRSHCCFPDLAKCTCRTLGLTELGLLSVNLGITLLLSLGIGDSILAFQRFAQSTGIPLRLVYGLVSVTVLILPCYLMGLTMSLASETCQRQLGQSKGRVVDLLFAVNTVGAVIGTLVSSFWLMPYFGQMAALFMAASCNGLAALILLFVVCRRCKTSTSLPTGEEKEGLWTLLSNMCRGGVSLEEGMGFFLGFLSLSYEMLLFRIVPLAHEPLPYTFAVVLCVFLLFWSIGVFLATKLREQIPQQLLIAAALISAMPMFNAYERLFLRKPELGMETGVPLLIGAVIIYSLPCLSFGLLFGQLIGRHVKNWGRDVGRYYALNTFGAFLGILVMTLLGFELDSDYATGLISTGFVLAVIFFLYKERRALFARRPALVATSGTAFALALAVILAIRGLEQPRRARYSEVWSGRDGVVELDLGTNLWLDGLWHSGLATNNSHIGKNNWIQAVIPALCYSGAEIKEALVIGLATGITAGTLAKLDSIESIDGYEINHTLLHLLKAYPDGTLNVLTNPKVNVIWHDARSGLELNPKKYDLITQAPLHLKQAGSSLLLSKEYLELLAARLTKDGIACVYANGNEAQGLLVRKTAASVFPYYESFLNGYVLLLSHSPIRISEERFAQKLAQDSPLWIEARAAGAGFYMQHFDSPKLDWESSPYVITDDHPLVEYPDVVNRLISSQKAGN